MYPIIFGQSMFKSIQGTQLELDFSVLPEGSLVQAFGYDSLKIKLMDGDRGVIEYLDKSGEYVVYFPHLVSPWGGAMMLRFRRDSLVKLQGKGKRFFERKREVKKL